MGDFLVPLIVFSSITAIVIFVASRRHTERMEMIRRGMNPVLFTPPKRGNKSLLFGLIFVAVGLAILVSVIAVPRHFDHDTLTISLMFLLGGVSLLIFWRMTAGDREWAIRDYERRIAEAQDKSVETHGTGADKAAAPQTGN